MGNVRDTASPLAVLAQGGKLRATATPLAVLVQGGSPRLTAAPLAVLHTPLVVNLRESAAPLSVLTQLAFVPETGMVAAAPDFNAAGPGQIGLIRATQSVAELITLRYANLDVTQSVAELITLKYPNLWVTSLCYEVIAWGTIDLPGGGLLCGVQPHSLPTGAGHPAPPILVDPADAIGSALVPDPGAAVDPDSTGDKLP